MRKETILKISKNGHYAKVIAFAKWSVWVKNYNCEKHAKNSCRSTLQLYYAKNGSKKQLIFEKWDHFENMQKWPQCKGYSLCKMVSLAQKLKCQKHVIKDSTSTLDLFYAKNGSKKKLIFEKWDHFENWQKWPLCKGYSLCKVVSLGQKLKLRIACEKQL